MHVCLCVPLPSLSSVLSGRPSELRPSCELRVTLPALRLAAAATEATAEDMDGALGSMCMRMAVSTHPTESRATILPYLFRSLLRY